MLQILPRDLGGVFLIDKPAGITSNDAIQIVKNKFKLDKIGHTGTLDPMATGLLVCPAGAMTRLIRFLEGGSKTYSGKIKFGLVTDSDDITGNKITESFEYPEFGKILEALSNFIGEIDQIPPKVSAIKINGERSYKLVRKGQDPVINSRKVKIDQFLIDRISPDVIKFKVVCSRGTYIRSLARDLGAILGCGGCLKTIRREETSGFSVESAKDLDSLAESDMIKATDLFAKWPQVQFEDSLARRINGGDQEALKTSEVQTLVDKFSSNKFLIYSSKVCPTLPLGLLEKIEDTWKVGVNF
ncbi:MAG: tRNA pseudouridine(55) synthase TruB [bacterium]|nr:tRNA pseudouridine(55) synthase TruB [bacterium]